MIKRIIQLSLVVCISVAPHVYSHEVDTKAQDIALKWLAQRIPSVYLDVDELPFYEVPSRYIMSASQLLLEKKYVKEALDNDVVAYAGGHYKSEKKKSAYLVRGAYFKGSGRFIVHWDLKRRYLQVVHLLPGNGKWFLLNKTKQEMAGYFKPQPLVVSLEEAPDKVSVSVAGAAYRVWEHLKAP